MSLPFSPLFLICLLFADLTDDVIALVCPSMPVGPPSNILEESYLLSVEYRAQCDEEIRPPVRTWGDSPLLQVFLLEAAREVLRPVRRDYGRSQSGFMS